jgi:hypothetical protein
LDRSAEILGILIETDYKIVGFGVGERDLRQEVDSILNHLEEHYETNRRKFTDLAWCTNDGIDLELVRSLQLQLPVFNLCYKPLLEQATG